MTFCDISKCHNVTPLNFVTILGFCHMVHIFWSSNWIWFTFPIRFESHQILSNQIWFKSALIFGWLHHHGLNGCITTCPILEAGVTHSFDISPNLNYAKLIPRFHVIPTCDSNLKFPYHRPCFFPGVDLLCLACWCLSMRSRLNGRNALFWNYDHTFLWCGYNSKKIHSSSSLFCRRKLQCVGACLCLSIDSQRIERSKPFSGFPKKGTNLFLFCLARYPSILPCLV